MAALYISIFEVSLAVDGAPKFQDLSGLKTLFSCTNYFTIIYISFNNYGDIYEISLQVLADWKKNAHQNIPFGKNKKQLMRQFNSAPPVKTYTGCFHFVTKDTFFVVMDTVVNNTVTLLLL